LSVNFDPANPPGERSYSWLARARDRLGISRKLVELEGLPESRKQFTQLTRGRFSNLNQFFHEAASIQDQLEPLARKSRLRSNDLILIALVRNEALRLPAFLAHYRRLGVDQFFIVDNDSMDDSREFLLSQPDVNLWLARGKYDLGRHLWVTAMIQAFARNRWAVVADADEFLVFDGMERHDLHDLAAWLDRQGEQRLRAFLVDLYGRGAVRETPWPSGDNPFAASWWFDGGSYHTVDRTGETKGGPRMRKFSTADAKFANTLQKFPLSRADAACAFINGHYPYPFHLNRGVALAAVLHLKFTSDFERRVRQAVSEGQYWNNSYEYRVYQSALEADSDLNFFYKGSLPYEGVHSLIKAGLIKPIDWHAPPRNREIGDAERGHRRHAFWRALVGPRFSVLRRSRP
jgi:hypothetical protein